jgi:hypothetical protein
MQCQEFVYRIQVEGMLDENWSDWLGHMAITRDDGITTLTGPIADQADLLHILIKLGYLGRSLVSVTRTPSNLAAS